MRTLTLNEIGVVEGTDKSSGVSFAWDYLRHYERWFSPWRDSAINLIEIGVAEGASLRTMHSWFSRAKLVGIDLAPQCARFAGGRIAIEIGSQDDPEFLHGVLTKFPPTIIIDDGSHRPHHIIFSFETMFPRLLPGGVYVIEDLAFHFGDWAKDWQAPVEGLSAPEYFLDLARSCLSRRASPKPIAWGTAAYLARTVDVVEFIGGAVLIRKSQHEAASFDLDAAIAYADERGISRGDAVARYCDYGSRIGIDIRTIEAALTGVPPEERSVRYYHVYSDVLRGLNRLEEAIAIVAEGAQRFNRDADMLWRCGHFMCEGGRYEDGIDKLALAASLYPGSFVRIIEMIDNYSRSAGMQAKGTGILRRLADGTSNMSWRDAIKARTG